MEFVRIPDIVFSHQFRILIHELQRGHLGVFVLLQSEGVVEFFIIPRIYIVITQLHAMFPQADPGLRQPVQTHLLCIFRDIDLRVELYAVRAQYPVIGLHKILICRILAAIGSNHIVFQICSVSFDHLPVQADPVSVQIIRDPYLQRNIQFRIGDRFFQRQAAGFIQEFHDLPNPFRYAGILFPEFIGDQIGFPEMPIVLFIVWIPAR